MIGTKIFALEISSKSSNSLSAEIVFWKRLDTLILAIDDSSCWKDYNMHTEDEFSHKFNSKSENAKLTNVTAADQISSTSADALRERFMVT